MTAHITDGTGVTRIAGEAPEHGDSLATLRAEAERLMRAAGRPVRRVSLRAGGNAIEVDWETGDEPAGAAAPVGPADPPVEEAAGEDRAIRVVAPLVGTFYHAPSPGDAPFVEVGDVVEEGQQLGIIEAMKLMNPITADRPGRVRAIRVPDGDLVEFEQVLVELDPVEEV
ncbi:acetyl-CoA carboxylase biotin carboxyl carrier protein subunit [Saccharopolyspora erythraea]|uniref:acetyl-CoA carboxylase biotin carboxyl carrier protein n=1 Tax=Saccharopolyspora erythraea TaxID=1836 RepID=UPI001BA94D8B|nr:biotin/lipoyl-containing protein [Saccharopolyspora erythraea]QUG99419.1 acetyl-CoA carboxylase biotin carboxyl carrier protein subunit [Saccharopolyspora erythraea]